MPAHTHMQSMSTLVSFLLFCHDEYLLNSNAKLAAGTEENCELCNKPDFRAKKRRMSTKTLLKHVSAIQTLACKQMI